ncbi:hypothetical protein VNO77_19957 [Canavalia gladiata]|uniref:Uncharacterized protein n=1 Tax=Canavalia gladiata TaxID=3824 RepID=A0AAN9LNN5_CANGL
MLREIKIKAMLDSSPVFNEALAGPPLHTGVLLPSLRRLPYWHPKGLDSVHQHMSWSFDHVKTRESSWSLSNALIHSKCEITKGVSSSNLPPQVTFGVVAHKISYAFWGCCTTKNLMEMMPWCLSSSQEQNLLEPDQTQPPHKRTLPASRYFARYGPCY